MPDQDLLGAIRVQVEKLNSESQDHARIPFDMLIPLPHLDQPLEKSSKGTIIRRAAEARFVDIINDAYASQDSGSAPEVSDEDLSQYLIKLIQSMTGQESELSEDMDLFSYGVDSIACIQLRTRLRRLIPSFEGQLPMSVVEDCGTIRRLTDFVLRRRHGESDAGEEDESKAMIELVKQYGSFEASQMQTSASTNRTLVKNEDAGVIVLSGATGALGAHILDLLRKRLDVEAIYCLVRGADEHAARERVSKALEQRGLSSLGSSGVLNDKIKVVPSQLGEERLGLSDETYNYLAQKATSVIHIAWTVNFRLKLRSFVKDNIAGVRNLLNLALAAPRSHPPRFTYCSSTAAIINAPIDQSNKLPEQLSSDPSSASPLGYSRSKWVAEHICLSAHEKSRLHGRIAVVRVGQLTGASTSGIWNTKEAWPMMLSTASLIHCLPDLGTEPLDWLPVDLAAKAFVQTTMTHVENTNMPVYHVLNPHQEPTWHQMLLWLQKKGKFDIVSRKEWVQRLEQSENSGHEHSALKLLGLWKEAYAGGESDGGVNEVYEGPRKQFDTQETCMRVEALRDVMPLDEDYMGRVWDWIQREVR